MLILYTSSNKEEISNISLLLQALGIEHCIKENETQLVLEVKDNDYDTALSQLTQYISENENWPPPRDASRPHDSGATPAFFIISALFLFFFVTGPWSMHSSWFAVGMSDASAIQDNGEFFRLITSLTLHADLSHLLGNCLLGGFLLHFFLKNSGYGIGTFAVFFVGGGGNALNVFFRSTNHLSVGFSTAVFGILGMMVFISYFQNQTQRTRYSSPLIPLLAAMALLALLGSSGERTDIGAHFFGFTTGLFVGRFLALPQISRLKQLHLIQVLFFFITATVIVISWREAWLTLN